MIEVNAEPTLEQRIVTAYRQAIKNFETNHEVQHHLTKRFDHVRQQVGQLKPRIESMSCPPNERATMVVSLQAMLESADRFFTEWHDVQPDQAQALLYRQTLPAPPNPPTEADRFDGTLHCMRHQRSIQFRTSGTHLAVHPASILTAEERGFISREKTRILAIIRSEEDVWLA